MIIRNFQLGPLELEIHKEALRVTLFFKGIANENFLPSKVLQFLGEPLSPAPQTSNAAEFNDSVNPSLKGNLILLNLEHLKQMNSRGVREWILFVQTLPKSCTVRIEKASIVFMDQFNILPAVVGNARIESFFAPYYCSSCEAEVSPLLVVHNHMRSLELGKAPPLVHNTCGNALEFDASEEIFFGLLRKFS